MHTRPAIDGSPVCRKYRVEAGYLLVTADRKIYLTTAPLTDGFGFSHVANVGDRMSGDTITKANIRRAANC